VSDTLYFGTAKPASFVSAQEGTQFADAVITHLFPKVLTLSQASGQWQTADGAIVREPANVLQIVHAGRNVPDEAAEREFIDAYK